jgi:hypothetical protein
MYYIALTAVSKVIKLIDNLWTAVEHFLQTLAHIKNHQKKKLTELEKQPHWVYKLLKKSKEKSANSISFLK